MQIVADTHVHLYDSYDIAAALTRLCANLAKLAESSGTNAPSLLAACLTERQGSNYFERLLENPPKREGLHMAPGHDASAINVTGENNLTLYAGSQIITAERIEILALVCRERISDGLSASETLAAIREANGVPVLPWSPGKWLGARGACVRNVIENAEPASLCVGDTAMRPVGFPKPGLIRAARTRGHALIAGTDPLPVAGEENIMGTYASRWNVSDEEASTGADGFRALLRNPASAPLGRRNTLLTAARRWIKNARSKS